MRVCLIAGRGQLPEEILMKLKSLNFFYTVIGLRNNHDLDLCLYPHSIELDIAKVGKAIEFCNDHKITHIVFAGNITRPNMAALVPDQEGIKLLWRIRAEKFLCDDKLLKVIIDFFETKGLKILSPSAMMEAIELGSGSLTPVHPSSEDLINIEIASLALATMSSLDIGQAVIISERRIIAVEAAEGTDEMIIRSKNYFQKDAIIVKMPKKNQDTRIDMPTIGPKTIDNMQKSNIKGLAIDKNVILLSSEDIISRATKAGIFVYII